MVPWTVHSSTKPSWVSKWVDGVWSGLRSAVVLFPPSCTDAHGFSTPKPSFADGNNLLENSNKPRKDEFTV